MSKIAIKIESLSKSYSKDKFALQNISLDIPQGSLIALIGRNAAGKTTLFSCIAGLINFDSGCIRIELDGTKSVLLTPERNTIRGIQRRKIGIVFQEMALWSHFTVLENVIYPLIDIHEYDRDEAESYAKIWLCERLKIEEEYLKKYPHQLSGGFQRRVALARTFVINPDILLIDEIEANLDPEAVEIVLRLLEDNFIHDKKKTVLMVTHRIDFLVRCASKVIVLDNGNLIDEGPPDGILENPNQKTGSFIRDVIDPSRSQWNFAYQCLESSIKITSLTLVEQGIDGNIFQKIAAEVLDLITKLEPNIPHFVLIVTKDPDPDKRDHLYIRGCYKSDEFILNGSKVPKLGDIVDEDKAINEGKKRKVERYKLIENYEQLIAKPKGVLFDSGVALSGSLIAAMFKEEGLSYRFADTYPPIQGAYNTKIPPLEDSIKDVYYEFSKEAKNVYLFQMKWEKNGEENGEENVVGVLSIDTYSQDKWLPFVVKQIKLIANLGAISIKIHKTRSKNSKNTGVKDAH